MKTLSKLSSEAGVRPLSKRFDTFLPKGFTEPPRGHWRRPRAFQALLFKRLQQAFSPPCSWLAARAGSWTLRAPQGTRACAGTLVLMITLVDSFGRTENRRTGHSGSIECARLAEDGEFARHVYGRVAENGCRASSLHRRRRHGRETERAPVQAIWLGSPLPYGLFAASADEPSDHFRVRHSLMEQCVWFRCDMGLKTLRSNETTARKFKRLAEPDHSIDPEPGERHATPISICSSSFIAAVAV